MKAEEAEARLRALADEEVATGMQRFFKTGPGQYGEGDSFLGIKAAPLKKLARECRSLSLDEAKKLLGSAFHEARMLALLVLVGAFEKGDETSREAVYDLYLANTARVNNWDLVDASAPAIVGGFLAERDREPLTRLAGSTSLWERRIAIVATQFFIRRGDFADTLRLAGLLLLGDREPLTRLAGSTSLWERRIAIVATQFFIRRGDFADTLRLAGLLLLGDREDLIHKAAGWMLREVGKRDQAVLEGFLAGHCRRMPRTMLRYAIERLPEERRRLYLRGEVPSAAASHDPPE